MSSEAIQSQPDPQNAWGATHQDAEPPIHSSARPPTTNTLSLIYAASLVVALLAVVCTIAGLAFGADLYKTEEMLLARMPTDLFTLIVALPLHLLSIWLAFRGKLLGLLCWPGLLLYFLYIYLAYAIGVPLSVLFFAYAAIAALSTFCLIGLLSSINARAVRQRLQGAVPNRIAGTVLIVVSLLFTAMNVSFVLAAISNPSPGRPTEFSVWLVDFVVLGPAWLMGGILLIRREALGYVAGAGLFLLCSLLFLGPVFVLAFPTFYSGALLPAGDILFMLVMTLIGVIPFVLFARGILRTELPT